jgi:hypothetical protein
MPSEVLPSIVRLAFTVNECVPLILRYAPHHLHDFRCQVIGVLSWYSIYESCRLPVSLAKRTTKKISLIDLPLIHLVLCHRLTSFVRCYVLKNVSFYSEALVLFLSLSLSLMVNLFLDVSQQKKSILYRSSLRSASCCSKGIYTFLEEENSFNASLVMKLQIILVFFSRLSQGWINSLTLKAGCLPS